MGELVTRLRCSVNPDENSPEFQRAFDWANHYLPKLLNSGGVEVLWAALTVLADYYIAPGDREAAMDFHLLSHRASEKALNNGDE